MRCFSALSSGLTPLTPPPPVIRPPNAAADHQFVGAQVLGTCAIVLSILVRFHSLYVYAKLFIDEEDFSDINFNNVEQSEWRLVSVGSG